MQHWCTFSHLGQMVNTLLKGVHNDIIQLCQRLRTGVHVSREHRVTRGYRLM